MFTIAKKRANRIGCIPVKALFSIEIIDIQLSKAVITASRWEKTSQISVCFERGGKISATKNINVDKDDLIRQGQEVVKILVDEKVELVATLYKNTKTNSYQEKSSKLVLRKVKKNARFGLDTFLGLGKVELKLHDLAMELGYDQFRSKPALLKLELLEGAFLNVVVHTKILRQMKGMEDNASMMSYMSEQSDISTIGASFYYNDREENENDGVEEGGEGQEESDVARPEVNKRLEPIPQEEEEVMNSPMVSPLKSAVITAPVADTAPLAPEINTDDNNTLTSPGVPVSLSRSNPSVVPETQSKKAVRIAEAEDTQTVIASDELAAKDAPSGYTTPSKSASKSALKSPTAGAAASSTVVLTPSERAVLEMYGSLPDVEPMGVSMSLRSGSKGTPLSASRRAASNNDDLIEFYKNSLQAKTKRIQELEQEAAQRNDLHKEQVNTFNQRISALQTELMQQCNKSPEKGDIPKFSDGETTKLLNDAREQIFHLSSEYEKVSVDLQLASNEVTYYRELYEAALIEKDEETKAAQEAATVAVNACVKRADLDNENEELLQELINIKVLYANMCMDLDYERRKSLTLKKTLQYYSEKLASLEVKYSVSYSDEHRESTEEQTSAVVGSH